MSFGHDDSLVCGRFSVVQEPLRLRLTLTADVKLKRGGI